MRFTCNLDLDVNELVHPNGSCGEKNPLITGDPSQCSPHKKNAYCCGADGTCGQDCACDTCVDYREKGMFQNIIIQNIIYSPKHLDKQLLEIYSFVIDYVKTENKFCDLEDRYGKIYSTYEEAKQDCNNDDKCRYVNHQRCKPQISLKKSRYQKCPYGVPVYDSPISCLYEKRGMFLVSIVII